MMALFYPGFSIRFYVAGQLWSRWRGKKLAAKVRVCGKSLQSWPLRMHFQHSRAKIRVFEQNTVITILFLNRGNFQRKEGGEFM